MHTEMTSQNAAIKP